MNQRRAANLGFIVLLHLALLWAVMRPLPSSAPRGERIWIQLLRPLTPRPPATSPAPTPRPAAQPAPSKTPATTAPAAAAPPAAVEPAPPAPAPSLEALTTEAPAAPPADVVQQALKAVGAIDRQLRTEHRQALTSAPPSDSTGARLSKGIAAAHAAVGPKWFEAARIELFSAPNDPKRVYKVITAFGEYCLFYPDKASMSENAAAKGGRDSFGQPTMSTCPQRF
jgi:hypothetical protein